MTPTEQDKEPREQVLTEFKQVHKLAPADYTENCTNVVMNLIQAHTNAEIAKVLDRLEGHSGKIDLCSYEDIQKAIPLDAIQAERAKFKEVE